MGVSLAELKTGKEKLELINQILLRIDTIATALDNTRLDEIVGLKESVVSLHEQTLALKNEVLELDTNIKQQASDVNTKWQSVNENFTKVQDLAKKVEEQFNFIQNTYNDFSTTKGDLQAYKDFIEQNKPLIDGLKADLEKYELMKVDLDAIKNEVSQNKDKVSEFYDLNLKIKTEILAELDHALQIVNDLHIDVDELKELKGELLEIKAQTDAICDEAVKVVNTASEDLKNKINTIFFENQRLNQEMIEALKRLEEIDLDVNEKYELILKAYELLMQTQSLIDSLKASVEEAKKFASDLETYAEMIKDFRQEITNLKADLDAKVKSINDEIKLNKDKALEEINTQKDYLLIRFEELKARLEVYNQDFKNAYDRFVERALIANEDLGRLAEVAKKELANDKLIYETELKALRDDALKAMQDVANSITGESDGILAVFESKKQEFITLVDTSKVLIDNLNNVFNANYQEKKNEFGIFVTQSLQSLNANKDDNIKELNAKKEEYKQELETKKSECIAEIDAKADEYDIANIKAEVETIKSKNAEQEGKITANTELINNTKTELNSKIDTKVSELNNAITTKNEETKTALNAEIAKKVSLSGDETIAGNKTLSNNLIVNGTTTLKTTNVASLTASGNLVANGTTTLKNTTVANLTASGTVTLNGAIALNGAVTSKSAITASANPSNDNHLTRKWYVDYGGGVKSLGNQTAPKIDLRQAQHFNLTMTAKGAIGVENWGGAGKSGTITINNAQNITSFSAPFKFRIAQSGFSGTETFAYFCIASNNIKLVRT
ncbi:hypothetical protein [Campylobacter sp. CCS1377]|uniref:Uncharacterized protein n=1 Tax=Campylobacter sp. CCS1377 TaxID=3158229 RepID=A0AAU7E5H4_9BACT